MPTILTAEEVAARLNVNKKWVYRHADDLGGFHLGRLLRFTSEDVDAYLVRARRPQPAAPPHQRSARTYRVSL